MSTASLRVLFLCVGNSCRSQMAEGLARHLGRGRIEAASAGTAPKGLHPLAVRAMAEIGIDIAQHRSEPLDLYRGRDFTHVITVCDPAKDACPTWPGARALLHWSFDDPVDATGTEEERLAVFRRVRDEIRLRIEQELLPLAA